MARQILHLVTRRAGGAPAFVDDVDRETYLELLGGAAVAYGCRVLAYCLMGNHTHLLVEGERAFVRRGAWTLRRSYANAFGVRHGASGRFWDAPRAPVRVTDDAQLWAVVAYIARNPVEAGFCRAPEAWRWSSHRATLGAAVPPAWLDIPRLLDLLGDPDATRYATYVSDRGEVRAAQRRWERFGTEW